jgi:ribosomal protein L16/L10AE
MVVFNKNINEVKIQKHRTYLISKEIKFKFGEYAFVSSKETKIELNQLTFLKKIIKKVVKRKRKKKNRKKKGQMMVQGKSNRKKWKAFKIWFFLLPNYVFSKKSKNSRMGKGKGSFLR